MCVCVWGRFCVSRQISKTHYSEALQWVTQTLFCDCLRHLPSKDRASFRLRSWDSPRMLHRGTVMYCREHPELSFVQLYFFFFLTWQKKSFTFHSSFVMWHLDGSWQMSLHHGRLQDMQDIMLSWQRVNSTVFGRNFTSLHTVYIHCHIYLTQ